VDVERPVLKAVFATLIDPRSGRFVTRLGVSLPSDAGKLLKVKIMHIGTGAVRSNKLRLFRYGNTYSSLLRASSVQPQPKLLIYSLLTLHPCETHARKQK
jgi:hypothetical protein